MPDNATPFQPVASAVIACGGTGGHLFPGLAVAEELRRRDCRVTLMVSPKEVDQQAIAAISDMEIVTLPAVALNRGGWINFLSGFWKSYRMSRRLFARQPPDVVLAMGGFVSAPPIAAGKRNGAKTFIHESNSIPGRANRWLARWVDGAFVYFPTTQGKLLARRVEVSGMPVRPQFLQSLTAAQARTRLGLNPNAPVLLIMGGSQGASKINELALAAASLLRQSAPDMQFVHLTGASDLKKIRDGYEVLHIPAVVQAFFDDMGAALAAASAAVSRAGASSLAELAARGLPAVLIPYPTAADNHQYFNALALAQSGAALMLEQTTARPEALADNVLDLLTVAKHSAMQRALAAWHAPGASVQIAESILHWDSSEHQRRHLPATRQRPVLNF